ncbi:unnamed protein product [Vitrella brassicaformis CCMP3155]|uniref:Uncharacterized protein n=1 Tax=Vitrella brassicaformis (strain CCMP3155) TaxID=1169540 RepID=A0A0G4FM86_VITBC|nr:unnamed protein product [Vitrella brassicaformis CCMP3155]|eukprot:CEM15095.1 unnamed protein product [Vitrella brassicaformis CCMP3155]
MRTDAMGTESVDHDVLRQMIRGDVMEGAVRVVRVTGAGEDEITVIANDDESSRKVVLDARGVQGGQGVGRWDVVRISQVTLRNRPEHGGVHLFARACERLSSGQPQPASMAASPSPPPTPAPRRTLAHTPQLRTPPAAAASASASASASRPARMTGGGGLLQRIIRGELTEGTVRVVNTQPSQEQNEIVLIVNDGDSSRKVVLDASGLDDGGRVIARGDHLHISQVCLREDAAHGKHLFAAVSRRQAPPTGPSIPAPSQPSARPRPARMTMGASPAAPATPGPSQPSAPARAGRMSVSPPRLSLTPGAASSQEDPAAGC